MELTIVASELFGSETIDFYQNEANEIFMTSQQLGRALEYKNPIKAISNIFDRNRARLELNSVVLKLRTTDEKAYETRLFDEKGIYEVIRFSKQAKANEFYDWVYVALRDIRKHGVYMTPDAIEKMLHNPDFLIQVGMTIKEERAKRAEAEAKLKIAEPKVQYYDDIIHTENTFTITQFAKADYGWSAQKLNRILAMEGVQFKVGGQWVLNQKYEGLGYARISTHPQTLPNGETRTRMQLEWTQKGREFIYHLMIKRGHIPNPYHPPMVHESYQSQLVLN